MALQTGTHTIADLAQNQIATTTVQEFGLENLNEAIQADLEMHNRRIDEMLSELVEQNDERSTIYGTNAQGEAVQKDEYTRAPTQKITGGSKVEFPLDGYEYGIGWTAEYLRAASVQDMAKGTISARQAHVRQIAKDLRTALFSPTNTTWTDRLYDSMELAVKRLVNGDSLPIPNGPNGETFDAATHTHYDAIDWAAANVAARDAFVRGQITDVVEHGHGADLRVFINRAQETDFRGLDGFEPLTLATMVYRGTDTAAGPALDVTKIDNRQIGYYDGIPVWTKPWVPPLYDLIFASGDPMKTLRMRQSPRHPRGLFIAADIIVHPLQARYMNFYHGFGVHNRTNGAVGYLGGGTYTAPTFTL